MLEDRTAPAGLGTALWSDDSFSGYFNEAFTAEGRIGNTLGGGGTFEVDIGPSTSQPAATRDYRWSQDLAGHPFTLSYDPATGLATFDNNGAVVQFQLTWSQAFGDSIFVRAAAHNSGSSMRIGNLELYTPELGSFISVPTADGDVGPAQVGASGPSAKSSLQLYGLDLQQGFVLRGRSYWTFSASGPNAPTQSRLAFQIKVGNLATVSIAATDSAAAEAGTAPGTFTVTLTGKTTAPLTVLYVVNGTAEAGSDYAPPSGLVTIPAGSASATITVTPQQDAAPEVGETVEAFLLGEDFLGLDRKTYSVGAQELATLTILDDDAGDVVEETDGYTFVEEGGPPDNYSVVLNRQPTADVTVIVTTSGTLRLSSSGQPTPGSSLTLVFTPANWNAAQIVQVSAVIDPTADGPRFVGIDHQVFSADPFFQVQDPPEVRRKVNALIFDKPTEEQLGSRAYWQDRALVAIQNYPGMARATNDPYELSKRRTAAYVSMFNQDTVRFRWAGMAAFASNVVGMAIYGADRAPAGAFGGADNAKVKAMLREGNAAVYNDIYWQHYAYQIGGMAAMRKLKDNGAIDQNVLDAWAQIDDGANTQNNGKIWAGNRALLRFEQEFTLQTVYDNYRDTAAKISDNVLFPLPPFINAFTPRTGSNFSFYMQTRLRRKGDIGNFEDRWNWIDNHMLPHWQDMYDKELNQAKAFVNKLPYNPLEKALP